MRSSSPAAASPRLSGPAAVKFGTVNATSYTINSTTQITAVAPAGSSGTTVDVTVTNTVGTSGTSGVTKYSYGGPVITSINPKGGPAAGGTLVAITGTGFTGVTSVKFGDKAATTYTVGSSTSITATAPAGTSGTTVEVTVTTTAGTSPTGSATNDYSYGIPTVSSLTPAAGPFISGTSVVITGANFLGTTSVMFGTLTAAFTVNSATQITATAPGGANGSTVDVVITNAAGKNAESVAAKYSYGIPTITKLEPSAGPPAGANSVVITGTGFTGVSSVKFGGNSASFTVDSADLLDSDASQTITAVAPSGTLNSTVEVTVTTPAGTNTTTPTTNDYRYIGVPTVSAISPTSGLTSGGTSVVITGTYFIGLSGTSAVQFGSKDATSYTVNSDTQITAVAPSGTGTVQVKVTNPVGTSSNTPADDFFYGKPVITGLNPPAGVTSGPYAVVISGSGFTDVDWVRFYYDAILYVSAVNFTVNSSSQITAVVPNHVPGFADGPDDVTVDVVVHNATGTSASGAASKFTYGPPLISSVDPSGGPTGGGNSIVITGRGFTGTSDSMSVMFGTAPGTITAINYVNTDNPKRECTKITVTAPPKGAMSSPVTIRVTTPVGFYDWSSYYYGVPTVTNLNPVAGSNAGGNSVVITGSGFTGATDVLFDADNTAPYTVDSDTQITVSAPNGPDYTLVDVTVVGIGGGTSATGAATKYNFGEPQVDGLNPSGGPTAGGTSVIITGTGFRGVSSVMFGTTAASFTVNSATQITATAPSSESAIPVNVTVTNPAGTSSISGSGNDYSYGLPTVTSISPAAGAAAGGYTVTINGTSFGTAPTVKFSSTSATVLTSSATLITVTAPPGTLGETVHVNVTNGAYTSAPTRANEFSYGPPTITDLNDNGGATTGGEQVEILGTGFTGVTGASAVKFGGTNATSYTVDSYGKITAVAPAGTGTVHVTVTTPAGTSAIDTTVGSDTKYSYGLPTVASLSPAAGGIGTGVIITGTNLSGVEKVHFGTAPVPFIVINSDTQITVQAPGGGSHPWPVVVTNGYGDSTVTSIGQYYSYFKPTVDGLSPDNGPTSGGTTVVITGTNFTGVTSVMFEGVSVAYTVNSPIQITATAPPAPGGTAGQHVTVTVTNLVDTSSATKEYAYGVPTVSGVTPAAGALDGVGETVVITGTNFVNVPASNGVVFYDPATPLTPYYATAYTVNNSGQITVTGVPNGPDYTTVDVRVLNGSDLWSATNPVDEYSFGVPKITNLSPPSGSAGTSVTITGVCFTGVTSVTFGGVSASYTVNSPTSITAIAPSGLSGSQVVKVTNAEGESTVTMNFNY